MLALFGAVGPLFASRETPTNGVSPSLAGKVSLISRCTDDFTGSRAEFEKEYVLPGRLSVQELDLLFDAAGPATVDLRLDSVAENDRSVEFVYRDLRAYVLTFSYADSSFFDRPVDQRSHRRTYEGEFLLRKFDEYPVRLFWEAIAFQGEGANNSRNHDVHRVGVWADLNTDFGQIEIEIPVFRLEDSLDPRNNVNDATYRLGFHRSHRDVAYSLTCATQVGKLPYFQENYTFQDAGLQVMASNLFGFHDLGAALRLAYTNRPRDVVRNLHVQNSLLGGLTITIVPLERCSVQCGIARKTARTRRLNPDGLAVLDRNHIASISSIEKAYGYEQNEPLALETYAKASFNKWNRCSGHYPQALSGTNPVLLSKTDPLG